MKTYLFFLGAAGFAVPLAAQDAVEESAAAAVENAEAEEAAITVTATGLAGTVVDTGQPVTVILRAEIESIQGPDIARILQRAPAVTITRNGPLGSFTGVSLRGAASEQVLVLIDGVRVADQASPSGGFDSGTLDAATLGAVDLLRGANSTVWGADALGGVVDLSTRARSGVSGRVEYGARDTLSAGAAGGLAGETYAVDVHGSYLSTDGFSAAATGTEADGLEQISLGGSAFVDLTDRLELFANARYARADLAIDGFPAPLFALADTLETQHTRQHSGALGLAWYGQDLTLRAAYGLSDTERTNRDPAFGPTFASDGHTDSVTLRGEYRAIGGLTLAFGGEHQWAAYETSYDSRATARIAGAYLQAGWVMGGLAAHAGARLDDHERFGSTVSFGGDLSYRFAGAWRLRASVGEGFKAPTLFQLYSDFGTATLRPETSTSFDIGVEHGARGEGLHLAATLFRRDSDDLIGFDAASFTYANTARARAQGLELEAGVEPAPGLRLAGVYALIDAEDRATGRDLARRPRHAATLYADYTAPFGLALGADLRLVSGSFDDAANTLRLGGYEVIDVRASFPLTGTIELYGRVENLLDAEYQTAAGYGSPGRGGFVGVRARL